MLRVCVLVITLPVQPQYPLKHLRSLKRRRLSMSKELDPEKKISLQEIPEIKAIAVPDERTHFKKLMLSNPNFFGTFPDLGTIVKPIKGDTTFEQLTCLGLYPGNFFG